MFRCIENGTHRTVLSIQNTVQCKQYVIGLRVTNCTWNTNVIEVQIRI
jgi:hypothetical protein